MNLNKLTVLDCTFRDGGYYCDWSFHPTLIKKYLAAMEDSRVDIVEIGFRFMPKSRLLGPFAYTSDDFLKTLSLPKGINYSVMINASDLINFDGNIGSAVNLLFSDKSESSKSLIYFFIKDL